MKKNGQVILVVLLMTAVGMTVGLSLVERVTTDVKMTHQEEISSKTFNAAESGIEEALRRLKFGDTASFPFEIGNTDVNVQIASLNSGVNFVYPEPFSPGKFAVFWLRDHDADGDLNEGSGYGAVSLTVCWSGNAAVEMMLFTKDGSGNYISNRFALDPDGSRRANNGFGAPALGCPSLGLDYGFDISWSGTPLYLAVRPFYEKSKIGVKGTVDLPIQGYEITSSGLRENISRRVKVLWSWRAPLPIFFNAVYSRDKIDLAP